MLFRNGVGKISVDADFLHVRDNQDRWITEGGRIPPNLSERLHKVFVIEFAAIVRSLVLPRKTVFAPDIDKTFAVLVDCDVFFKSEPSTVRVYIAGLVDS